MSSSVKTRSPESHFAGLRRKDSKNALTTCHGLTDKGRACRRALASPKNSSKFDGAVVLTDNVDDPAIFFCWQHKDQADTFNSGKSDGGGSVVSLKGRHSLEEAFRSLGLDDVDEEDEPASKEASPSPGIRAHDHIPEPVVTVANHASSIHAKPTVYSYQRHRRRRTEHERDEFRNEDRDRRRRRRSEVQPAAPISKSSFSLFACCFGGESMSKHEKSSRRKDESQERPRPQPKPVSEKPPAGIMYGSRKPLQDPRHFSTRPTSPKTPVELRRKEVSSYHKTDSGFAMGSSDYRRDTNHDDWATPNHLNVPSAFRPRLNVYRDSSPTPGPRRTYQQFGDPKSDSTLSVPGPPPLKERSKSTPDAQQFQRLHGEWPPPLPRNATDTMRLTYAKLLTAMSEQPSKTDSPGYIYIFWQTEVEQTADETSAVASIISAPKLDRGLQRQETILQRRFFQTSANAPVPEIAKRKIFLKIGRAVNVHQRLNQWRKQCEYDITLLRSYPYDARKQSIIRPVPNVVKVERLIHLHLEMLGQRVSKQCRCGTEHKEWFEVDATASGVRDVDQIVRRWVRWSEDRFR